MTQDGADLPDVLNKVAAALGARNAALAAQLAEPALDRGHEHPLLLYAVGLRASELGRPLEALMELRRAQAISPPNPSIEAAIAQCLIRLNRIPDAITALEAALALQPGAAPLHYQLGWAYEMEEDLANARRAHERAIALNPNHASALGHLAFLDSRRGDWQNARGHARRALALEPLQTAATLALAAVETEERSFDDAKTRLDALLAKAMLGPQDRYIALGMLADIADAQNDVDSAYRLYSGANEVQAANTPPADQTMLSLVEELAKYMQRVDPPAGAGSVPGQQRHVFLLGFPRSGTTLLEQVLASHPEVVTLEEKDTLGDAVAAFMAQPADLDKLWTAQPAELEQFRDKYWQRVKSFGIDPAGRVFVDKTPINTVKLPLITRLFPGATILFAVRDPRDVVLSCFRRRFGANATTREFVTLEGTVRFYDAVMRLADLYRQKLSPDMIEVRNEDLISDFEGRMRVICGAIGILWDDAMQDFAARSKTRDISTPSATQVAKGINPQGSGQWRRYQRYLAPHLARLGPWIAKFGYAAD